VTAAPPSFYDANLTDRYEGRYRPLFLQAQALIRRKARVVELGCGTGRFAGLARFPSYIGLDFAPEVIAEAKRHYPAGDFRVADLRTDPIPPADVYVTLEVLEHLDDDLGLLERLPKGATVVLSVPSFDSASHVRHFPSRGSASARYGKVLRLDFLIHVPLPSGAYFHLMRGKR
jgi:trans-aconitate methyltransferase